MIKKKETKKTLIFLFFVAFCNFLGINNDKSDILIFRSFIFRNFFSFFFNHTESWCCKTTCIAISTSLIKVCLSFTSTPNYLSIASWIWIEVSTSIYPPSSLQCVWKLLGTPYFYKVKNYIPSFRIEFIQSCTDTIN